MSTFVSVRVADAFGLPLTTVANFSDGSDGAALDYVLSVGGLGVLMLTVPASFNVNLFKLDGRCGVWRSINGAPPALDGDAIFLIRKWIFAQDWTTIVAVHVNDLLRRRIIAYAAGSSYASKSAAAADDLIKTFVNENLLGGIVGVDRDGVETQADISTYLSKQANVSMGASVAKAAARRVLYDVVRELCEASTTAGTYLTADIVAPSESTLELRTYTTVRGVDHTATGAQPVILSVARGNLDNAILTVDRLNEVTFVIAGGTGEGTARKIKTAIDATRMGESPLNRIEQFVDAANIADDAQLQSMADAALRAGRPQITLMADLIETPATTRGVHFNLGDMVTMEHRGQQYDCRLDLIHASYAQGAARTEVHLKSPL